MVSDLLFYYIFFFVSKSFTWHARPFSGVIISSIACSSSCWIHSKSGPNSEGWLIKEEEVGIVCQTEEPTKGEKLNTKILEISFTMNGFRSLWKSVVAAA